MRSGWPVLLEANSLYVTTTQLLEGKFHWALIVTDHQCTAVKHHWYEKPTCDPTHPGHGLRASCSPVECYGFQRINPKSSSGRIILGYFKILGYTPPVSPKVITAICETAFVKSYTSVQENRSNGITCRTWVLEVLFELCALGIITGRAGTSNRDVVDALERVITDYSQAADRTYLTAYFTQQAHTFRSMVVAV